MNKIIKVPQLIISLSYIETIRTFSADSNCGKPPAPASKPSSVAVESHSLFDIRYTRVYTVGNCQQAEVPQKKIGMYDVTYFVCKMVQHTRRKDNQHPQQSVHCL